MDKIVINKVYDFNSLPDIEQDIHDALAESGIEGEFPGEFRLTISYVWSDKWTKQ